MLYIASGNIYPSLKSLHLDECNVKNQKELLKEYNSLVSPRKEEGINDPNVRRSSRKAYPPTA